MYKGVETLLSHTIKVQFPNLHEQFRNSKALTIMASKIGKVLEIELELEDSYIKRPVGPMITVETRDINKFIRYIRIPSMGKGATAKDTTLQGILYSGFLNQCQKCCRFGHFTQTCIVTKIQFGMEEIYFHGKITYHRFFTSTMFKNELSNL